MLKNCNNDVNKCLMLFQNEPRIFISKHLTVIFYLIQWHSDNSGLKGPCMIRFKQKGTTFYMLQKIQCILAKLLIQWVTILHLWTFKCLNLGQRCLFLVRIQCFDNTRKPQTVRAPLEITDNTKQLWKDWSGNVTDSLWETPSAFSWCGFSCW